MVWNKRFSLELKLGQGGVKASVFICVGGITTEGNSAMGIAFHLYSPTWNEVFSCMGTAWWDLQSHVKWGTFCVGTACQDLQSHVKWCAFQLEFVSNNS